jgi:proline utilization trans-activator
MSRAGRLTLHHPVTPLGVSLPPLPYALRLLNIFEYMFCDYHWYLRRNFRRRLHETYSDLESQTHDRTWLCQLLSLLALAQTFVYDDEKAGNDTRSLLPPGSDLFEQALLLLKPFSEEPTIADIETLNIIVSKAVCRHSPMMCSNQRFANVVA